METTVKTKTKTRTRPKKRRGPTKAERLTDWVHKIADHLEMALRLQVEPHDDDNSVTVFTPTNETVELMVTLGRCIPLAEHLRNEARKAARKS